MLSGRAILITGGTGSFGQALVRAVFTQYPDVRRVVVYSRDELKQCEMARRYPEAAYPQMRFFIGDIRDKERLYRAMEGVDVVVHAAALKHVPACEYNPFEAIKTNVLGAQNVVEAAVDCGVSRVVALSTDKAAAPINLYGATKLCSDKLFVSANNFVGSRQIKLAAVRYGNVMGSRGSVVPLFLQQRCEGVLPITDVRMTRFNITLAQGVAFVLFALEHMWGGEIFVPKIPSFRLVDLAEAIGPDCTKPVIGIRPGEKLHEEMITETDANSSFEFSQHYVILPSMPLWNAEDYRRHFGGERCRNGFSYSSATNPDRLSVEQLRVLIKKHVDPHFEVGAAEPPREGKHRLTIKSMAADLQTIAARSVKQSLQEAVS